VSASDVLGRAADWTTQRWVRLTGRTVRLADAPWLSGPIGRPDRKQSGFFEQLPRKKGW